MPGTHGTVGADVHRRRDVVVVRADCGDGLLDVGAGDADSTTPVVLGPAHSGGPPAHRIPPGVTWADVAFTGCQFSGPTLLAPTSMSTTLTWRVWPGPSYTPSGDDGWSPADDIELYAQE